MYHEEKIMSNNFVQPESIQHGTLPLSCLSSGSSALVEKVRGRDDAKTFLANLGFVENTKISVVSKVGGSVIVNVKGSKVAISKALASKIMATPL